MVGLTCPEDLPSNSAVHVESYNWSTNLIPRDILDVPLRCTLIHIVKSNPKLFRKKRPVLLSPALAKKINTRRLRNPIPKQILEKLKDLNTSHTWGKN